MLHGYLFDRPDARDREFAFGSFLSLVHEAGPLGSSEQLPASASLRVTNINPVDQVGESCVGFSTSAALRVAYLWQLGVDPGRFSAFDLYYKSRKVWGGENEDQGTYLRTTFRALQLLGCALEKDSPSTDHARINHAPTWRAQKSAHRFRGLRNYYPIVVGTDRTADQVRLALSRKLPVVGGWMVGDEFRGYDGSTVLGPEPKGDAGHAYWIEEYNSDGTFGIFNSLVNYGKHIWGRDGRATVNAAHVSSAHVLWAVSVANGVKR